jgi:hypothetical protein
LYLLCFGERYAELLQVGGVIQQGTLRFRRYVTTFPAHPMRLPTQGAAEALSVKAGTATFNASDHERKDNSLCSRLSASEYSVSQSVSFATSPEGPEINGLVCFKCLVQNRAK